MAAQMPRLPVALVSPLHLGRLLVLLEARGARLAMKVLRRAPYLPFISSRAISIFCTSLVPS